MDAEQLKATLLAYAQGNTAEAVLATAVARAHEDDPRAARRILDEALADGLIDAVRYAALCAPFERSAGDVDEHAAERTRVLPGGTGGRGRDDTPHTLSASDGSDTERTGTVPADGGDATQIAAVPVASRASEAAPATDTDRTMVVPAGEATAGTADVFDPTAPPDDAPRGRASAAGGEAGAGFVLKGRFRLIERLGEGGMGAVWKAVDKRKEEARDRNPHVAIKLLTGDFKQHPEAFIALQRETTKQQRLAHPNIATVYDFDRDGDTVFMTMEVLEGHPLDSYIRGLPAEGLPEADAMRLIEQLAAGLAYAHEARLVHSDLKPGNCYLTKEGTVKLLDFGIARASTTRTDAEGEKTLFDPAQLGALTPTYATVEMFDGKDPDPRDDIYALAIIAYQLLTGRHPYGKKSAPKALELDLEPAPVAKLDKRQNRALRRGLALQREQRTPTVAEFVEGLRRKKSRALPYTIAAVLLVALLVGLAWKPVMDYVRTRQNEAIIAIFMRGDARSIREGLARVQALSDPAQRQAIAEDERTRKAIIGLYVKRRDQHFDPAHGRYDFAGARREMKALHDLYPDSAEVFRIRSQFLASRDAFLKKLAGRLDAALAAGRLLPGGAGDNVPRILALARRVDPSSVLLRDPRIAAAYRHAAQASIADGDWKGALGEARAGLALVPGEQGLEGLQAQASAALARERERAEVASLHAKLDGHWRGVSTVAGFEGMRESLLRLQELAPRDALFAALRPVLQRVLGADYERRVHTGDTAGAMALLERWSALVSTGWLEWRRDALGARAGAGLPAGEQRGQLAALLGHPVFEARWEGAVGRAYRALVARVGSRDEGVEKARARLLGLYTARARAARGGGHFGQAYELLARAGGLVPQAAPALMRAQRVVARAAQARWRSAQAAQRKARMAQLEGALREAAAAGHAQAALAALQALRAQVRGAPEAFVDGQAPGLVAAAYGRAAHARAVAGDAEGALALVREGLRAVPGAALLKSARAAYERAVTGRALAGMVRGMAPLAAAPVAPGVGVVVVPPVTIAGVPGAAPAATPTIAYSDRYPALAGTLRAHLVESLNARVKAALGGGDWKGALGEARAGLALVPGEQGLEGLQAQASAALARERERAEVASLHAKLDGHWRGVSTVAGFEGMRESLLRLQELAPRDALFAALRPVLQRVLGADYERRVHAGDTAGAMALLERWSALVSTGWLEWRRDALGARAGAGLPVGEQRGQLAALLGHPVFKARWEGAVGRAYRALVVRVGSRDEGVEKARARLLALYTARASAAREGGHFGQAYELLARAGGLVPQAVAALMRAQRVVARAALARWRTAQAAQRKARMAQLEGALREAAAAGHAQAALAALQALRAQVRGAPDAFVNGQAPGLVAAAYGRAAHARAAAGDAEGALALVREGLREVPGAALLKSARAGYERAVTGRALAGMVRGVAPLAAAPVAPGVGVVVVPPVTVAGVPGAAPAATPTIAYSARYPALEAATRKRVMQNIARRAADTHTAFASLAAPLGGFAALYPGAASELRTAVAGALAARLAVAAGHGDIAALARPLAQYRALLPHSYAVAGKRVGEALGKRIRALEARDIKGAHEMLASARKVLPDAPPLQSLRLRPIPKPSRFAPIGMKQIAAGNLSAARATLARMLREEPGNAETAGFRKALEQHMALAQANYKRFRQYLAVSRQREGRAYLEQALKIWKDNDDYKKAWARYYVVVKVKPGACVPALAGYGRHARADCYDELGKGEKGPTLVVVPAGGAVKKPFAIGKYEVTVGDWNLYCRLSRACKPRTGVDPALPLSDVSAAQAIAYTHWLSKTTGAHYRLPTDREWSYAAEAGGRQPRKDFNCRVQMGGNIIKGMGLVNAESGNQNGWGLANYVGNVQELATKGSALVVRGGAYVDPLSKCGPSMSRPSNGAANKLTGFRVLRELG